MSAAAAAPLIGVINAGSSRFRCAVYDKPIIFAYHGYPWLIHGLTYSRTNRETLHVRGYKEDGTTTTPST